MDPITIAEISVLGFFTIIAIFEAIFYAVNTDKQTQAQKSIAESTKEGLEIQRSSAHSQSKIAENTSNFSSNVQNHNQSLQKITSNKKDQSKSQSNER